MTTSAERERGHEFGVVLKNKGASPPPFVRESGRLASYQKQLDSEEFNDEGLSDFVFNMEFIYKLSIEITFCPFGVTLTSTATRLSPSTLVISETGLGELNLSL